MTTLPTKNKKILGGEQRIFTFPNGFGASVVCHRMSYGHEKGLFELAVLGKDGELAYDTRITEDVLGDLTEEQVQETLLKIKELK